MTTIHATEHGRHQGWVDKHPQSYIHGVERWITNRSERVIACSHYMREQIADIFGVDEERVSVIPNGIDPDDLQPQDPAELARLRAEFAAPDEKLVLLIGRLVYEKGFQLALEAMPRLIEEVPGTRFLVAGSGTHEAELHRQAEELGLMEHGTFLGWIGDDVLHSLYRIADLTVVPSIYEPFGLVALEAMASGCPCIVADTGGLREVVPHEEAGLRFRARDPEALAEVAIRVLSDDELGRRLVAEAYEHLRRFDWADVAEQTAAVYAELSATRARQLSRTGERRLGASGRARPGRGQRRCSGASRMRMTRAGMPPTTALAGTSLVTTELVPIDRVVADADAAQDAGAVADPDVGADLDVALVDALLADRPLDLDDAVVEVDEHRPVGDHALLADPHPLVGGDRALLAHHGLRRRSRPRPRGSGSSVPSPIQTKRPKLDPAPRPIWSSSPRPKKTSPSVRQRQPARVSRRRQQVAPEQPPVAVVQHPVAGEEADRADHGGGGL